MLKDIIQIRPEAESAVLPVGCARRVLPTLCRYGHRGCYCARDHDRLRHLCQEDVRGVEERRWKLEVDLRSLIAYRAA